MTREERDVSRRELGSVLSVLGGAMGLAALAGCTNQAGAFEPEALATTEQALSGATFAWVDTIVGGTGTNLRTLQGSDSSTASKPAAVVGGYAAPGDGGGGLFYWDTSSSTGDDGGTIITVTGSTTGRWKRVYSGALDVRWFGAKGNGTTDDTAAINSALSVAKAGHATLFFSTGTYKVSSTLVFDDSTGVSLVGPVGRAAWAELMYSSASGSLISLHSVRCISFENMGFRYNNPSYAGNLIDFDWSAAQADPAYVTFANCAFAGTATAKNARSLIRLNRAIICTVERAIFNYAQIGILGQDGSYSNAHTIRECAFTTIDGCAIKNPGESWSILNCTFEPDNLGRASGIDTDAASYSYGLVVSACWFGDVGAPGKNWITLFALGANVSGNRMASAGAGQACVVLLSGCEGISINGNRLEGSIGVQLPVSGSAAFGVSITGNDLMNPVPIAGSNVSALAVFGNHGTSNYVTGAFSATGESSPAPWGVYTGYLSALPTNQISSGAALLDSATGLPMGSLGVFPSSSTSHNGEVILLARDGSGVLKASARFGPLSVGFYGTAPVGKPTVTGAKGGNAALTSLVTALAALGLITNSTT